MAAGGKDFLKASSKALEGAELAYTPPGAASACRCSKPLLGGRFGAPGRDIVGKVDDETYASKTVYEGAC